MTFWTFDILRQGPWGVWAWICLLATLVLVVYALTVRPRRSRAGMAALSMAAVGVAGTVGVVGVPSVHTAGAGLIWTFVLLGLVSAAFYLRLLPTLGPRRTALLLTLRGVAIALLLLMLFEPNFRCVSRAAPERPMVVLIDSSASMSFPDVPNGPSRLRSVWQAIRPQLPRLGEHFVPVFYTFDSGFRPLAKPEQLGQLTPDGQGTDLVAAVARALSASTRDDTVIVLVSDGIDNANANVVDAIRASRRPIHTVRVGSDQAEPSSLPNVAVESMQTADDFVVNHESPVKITVRSSALANRLVDVKLAPVDAEGKVLGEIRSEKLVLQPLPQGQIVELPFRPTTVGVQRLRAWVDEVPGERSRADNVQEIQGLAVNPRIRVLYIEGRVRPEFRDLRRALGRDPNIESATLLRIQNQRFEASGTVDGEAVTGLPTTDDAWRRFDVILLGDLDASFLSAAQQEGIRKAAEAGAGLLMIGGQNSFGPGNYKDSPVEAALPVFVGAADAGQESAEFVPRLTGDGLVHPAMEGLADWFGTDDKPATQRLPALRGNVVVPRARSGASVLLVHPGKAGPDGKPQIVLAVQPYGKGRSAALTTDTLYLWYTPLRAMGQDSPYNRFWGQLVRWLAGEDVRNRQQGAGMEALLNKSVFQLGESVKVRAMVRDEKGDATRYAQVSMTAVHEAAGPGAARTLPLASSETRTGMYEAVIAGPEKGDHVVTLVATKDGKEIARQTLKFSVIPPADEMLRLAANPQLLSAIADQTGGFHYELSQVSVLFDQLIDRDPAMKLTRQDNYPLRNLPRAALTRVGIRTPWPAEYDLPTQGLLVLLLLASEWVIRRRWQLT